MSDAYKSIKHGLTDAIAHARGKRVAVRVFEPKSVDVSDLRQRVGMTQTQFAARFGFSVVSLRHWERGDRKPHGPALVLLKLIDRDPKAVMRALA